MKTWCILMIVIFNLDSLKTTYIPETSETAGIFAKITTCPDVCTCVPSEKIVDCSNKNLTNLPDGIDKNVTVMNLSLNKFNGIPRIEDMKGLTMLDISHNLNIRFLEVNFRSDSLSSLLLNNCSIDFIDNSLFKGFPNLKILKLSANPISFLNNSLISSSLRYLDLRGCNLKHIKLEAFRDLSALSYISLNDNYNLRQFHSSSDSISILAISNSNLERLPSGNLEKLVELDLHGNNIQWLKNRSFVHMTNVENLNISFNSIKNIDVQSLSHLNRLSLLDLSYNRLHIIEENSFIKNEMLRSLYLSHNYMEKIEGFKSKSVELLDLSFCEISYLTKFSLRNLVALRELHLVRNQISVIPDKLYAPNLVYLDMSHNDISSINNSTFSSMKSLRFLVLSGNKLTTLSPNFFPQVIDLSIQDNPWLCDCDALRQLYNWMTRTDQNIRNLRCQLPTKLEGLTWEEACYSSWSKVQPERNVWWYSLSFGITIAVLLVLVYISKKLDDRKKEQSERQAETIRAAEQLEAIRRQQTRERLRRLEEQEASRNAPDPRESQGPPTYSEALMLPKLDASHPSLTGSLPSLSSIRGSNSDVSKRRRQRRKRSRKKSGSLHREVVSTSNLTETSDNERQLTATEVEESNF